MSTVAVRKTRTQQRKAASLQFDSHAVARAFPTLPKGSSRFPISRARNGQYNPLTRVREWFADAKASGLPSTVADEMVEYIETLRDEIWGAERLCVDEEMEAEQELDNAENLWQLRAKGDRTRYPAYIEALDAYIPRARRLRRALIQELEAGR